MAGEVTQKARHKTCPGCGGTGGTHRRLDCKWLRDEAERTLDAARRRTADRIASAGQKG